MLLCFTAGNDFLPASPGISISAGAISAITIEYEHTIPKLGEYIIRSDPIHAELV
jgi:5'-3' exonuclease